MSDLISRQAAIEVIDAVFPVDPMKSEYAQGIACGAALAKTYVKQLPSVQPDRDIPVKPIWITDSAWGVLSLQAVCPKCDYYLTKVYFIPNDTADTTHSRKVSYCSNCGQAIDWEDEK